MARKRKGPGGGNPAKPKVQDPCPRCKVRSRKRNKQGSLSIWCLTCSEKARLKGLKNPPAPLTLEVLKMVAKDLGIEDA